MSISLDIERELEKYPVYEDDSPWLPMLISRLSEHEKELLSEESDIYFEMFPLSKSTGMTMLEEMEIAEPTIMRIMAERHPEEARYRQS